MDDKNAIKYFLENQYSNSERKDVSKISISSTLYFFEAKNISAGRDLFSFCPKCKIDSSQSKFLQELPEINIPFEVSLVPKQENKEDKMYSYGEYYIFSPLIKSEKNDRYFLAYEKSNYESSEISLLELKKIKNGRFELAKVVKSAIFFH